MIKEANKRQNVIPEFVFRYFQLNKNSKPLPRTDESARIAIARKVDCEKRAMSHQDCLFKLVAPGTVIEPTTSTSNVMEPGCPAVCLKTYDLAKFGTKEERSVPLAMYASKRPNNSTKKLTEIKLITHGTEKKE